MNRKNMFVGRVAPPMYIAGVGRGFTKISSFLICF